MSIYTQHSTSEVEGWVINVAWLMGRMVDEQMRKVKKL